MTFFLILAGGLVTSTGSGLSVPDWPLSYGQVFPPMVGGIRFEHTHRVIAGFVGLCTLALSIAFFVKEKRRWVRFLSAGAFLLVILQAALGGITVIYLLPAAVSVAHACLAQTFFCALVSLALFTSREWREAKITEARTALSIQRLSAITAVFMALQLIAGAIVRHTEGRGMSVHLVIAFLILLHVLLVLLKTAKESAAQNRLMPNVILLGILVLTQIFLGFGAFIFTRMLKEPQVPLSAQIFFRTAHQANGALALAAGLVLALRASRLLKSERRQ